MEELDLKQLIKIFWNKRVHIMGIVLIFLIVGTIYTFTMVKPKYQSYTTLVLTKSEVISSTGTVISNTSNTQGITQTDLTINQRLASTYSELVKTKNVLREVIDRLKLDVNEEELKKDVKVSLVEDTELIKITVTYKNPTDAKNIANEIANIFSKKISEIYSINNVYIVDNAEQATAPCNINHAKDLLIFLVIGLVVSIIYVLLTNLLDTSIKSSEDVEKELEVSVLATIPEIKDETKHKGGLY